MTVRVYLCAPVCVNVKEGEREEEILFFKSLPNILQNFTKFTE